MPHHCSVIPLYPEENVTGNQKVAAEQAQAVGSILDYRAIEQVRIRKAGVYPYEAKGRAVTFAEAAPACETTSGTSLGACAQPDR